ncbi:MAG TPA: WYL domain-containing protein, partial [Gaiellaceae bacterium]|nr:WYL domain-containing protein [Gaiellaceae bacterium]
MSHDADKLIRQLSLVAFLMAERRLLTARDVKSNVEGYSEMSDEAFARRFYSDRAELTALGVPLQSQRDEFTGEELYTLRSEHYFLDRLDLDDDELAALQTALYYLEGKFAYAEPFRLALQNLALGRSGFAEPPTDTAERVRVSAPDYSPELAGRLAKLESAISKQRTVRFGYWSPRRSRPGERTVNPYALRLDDGNWYVIGHDLDRDTTRTFKVSRIRGDIRFATRRERDFRVPADFDVEQHRIPRPWQIGEILGRARIAVSEDTAWWVERTLSDAGTIEDGVFETDYATVDLLASWVLRQNGRAIPLEPDELVESVSDALASLAAAHGGDAPATAGPKRSDPRQPLPERPTGPVAPERFGVLQALLAHLLAACGDERSATLDADELAARFSIPIEELQDHLSLLNLVNFGGGCYAVYAEHDGDSVRVEKELYGDVFRRPPKLTPLEARAIRLAIEYVGPTIAADAHTPLKRVRKKLEETFGRFDLVGTPQPTDASAEESLVKVLSEGAEKRLVVEIEYLKEGDTPSLRQVEPYTIERELPVWRVHTWDRSVDAARTFRLDRMRSARLTGDVFEARDGFDPSYLQNPRVARLLHSPAVARWKLERGARPLTDGSAVADVPFKTEEWLLSEVLADRGETTVLEPPRLRDV